MPIDTAIYRRYGYENCFSLYSFEVNLSDIEYKNNKSVKLERITKMTDELADLLIEIYLEKAKNWDIYLERDRNHYYTYFEEIKVEAGEIFLAKNDARANDTTAPFRLSKAVSAVLKLFSLPPYLYSAKSPKVENALLTVIFSIFEKF